MRAKAALAALLRLEKQGASPGLVVQTCVKCHSGAEAKKGFRVDQELSDADRLKAIRRLLADDPAKRMPKGGSLDAQTLGRLIQELARDPPTD